MEVSDAGHAPQLVQAVIDTGYNGFFTLPANVIAALGPASAGYRRSMLADGTVSLMEVYLVTVQWHGQPKEVLALKLEGVPLVGMHLLLDCRLTIEVTNGGGVRIEELP